MSATAKTTVQTIRIPPTMINEIDHIITEKKTFTNKPDFVMSAVRFQINHTRDFVLQYMYSGNLLDHIWSDDELRWMTANASVIKGWDDRSAYRVYVEELGENESERILIRVPDGIIKEWEQLGKYQSVIKNFQDFVRMSIFHYMRHLKDNEKVDGMLHYYARGYPTKDVTDLHKKNSEEVFEDRYAHVLNYHSNRKDSPYQ